MAKLPTLEEWKSSGNEMVIGNQKVHFREVGNPENPTVVVLHGYPTCSFDFYKCLPLLAPHFHIVIHDHPGFGLSSKALSYSYSLIEQAEIALNLWKSLGIQEAHILGHDYGTSVATEILARSITGSEPVKIKSYILGNGSMHIEMAKLLPIQRLLRSKFWGPLVAQVSSKKVFYRNMRKIWFDSEKCDVDELDILYGMLWVNDEKRRSFPIVSRYIDERYKFWHRWIGALKQTDKPIDLLWAQNDPVAIVEMAHKLHDEISDSQLVLIKDCGHYPMLEKPESYCEHVINLVHSRIKE